MHGLRRHAKALEPKQSVREKWNPVALCGNCDNMETGKAAKQSRSKAFVMNLLLSQC